MTFRKRHSNHQEGGPHADTAPLLKDVALSATAEGITISDCSQTDNPLIYANAGFARLTGYRVEEVIGKNCRFLQGAETDTKTVARLREAIAAGEQCTVQLLNYRKDGTPFWNRLSVTPVRDASDRVTHYIGVQSDISEQKYTEVALREAKKSLEQANARMNADLAAAARVQRALLPQSLPETERLKLAWAFRPCTELAGDILNAFWLDDDHVALYLLDVSGHGVAAALLAVTVSRLLSTIPERSCLYLPDTSAPGRYAIADPAEVARALNAYFPLDQAARQYFTLLYGILNTTDLGFRYVAAGHPPPIHIRGRDPVPPLQVTGPPIGMLPSSVFETGFLRLQAGDRLYCYTDGIIEPEDPDGIAFGMDRVRGLLTDSLGMSLNESVASLMKRVDRWVQPGPLDDDASMLAVELH